ncbi:unnamed protein product [Darwinula stevensoni]|uniref:Uncharacterized protein n=1 Tax=Darwinula stevensoni TaxID=69355 RepID=A0A7R8X4A8_9CRUS|nr:unnamed protein product [Darwinula stevensoni]CAG0879484.1 unnamed protein product [Darwinula stevensoni]
MIYPLKESYWKTWLKRVEERMDSMWLSAHEAAMISSHKRNREYGESKLRFQAQIQEPYKERVSEEQSRYAQVLLAQKVQSSVARKAWRSICRYLKGPRGPWRDR